jgi:hypothetical protein
LKSDVAPSPSQAKTMKGIKKKEKNELCYDLILYPQRYVGNLEFILSTVTQKKVIDKKNHLNYVVT